MNPQSKRSEAGRAGRRGSPQRGMGPTRVDPRALPEHKVKRLVGYRDGMASFDVDPEEEMSREKKCASGGTRAGPGVPRGAPGRSPVPSGSSRLQAASSVSRRSLKDPDGASAPSSPGTIIAADKAKDSDPFVPRKDRSKNSTCRSQEPEKQKISRSGDNGKLSTSNPPVESVPNTNIAVACLVTFCFNLPLGVLAIYFSLMAAKAYRDGQAKKGAKRTLISIYISLFSIVLTVLIVMVVVLMMAMKGQGASTRRRPKTTIVL